MNHAMNPIVIMIVKYVMPAVAWVNSIFIPGRKAGIALQEAKNKAWIMSLVNNVESVVPPAGTYQPLGGLVDACYAMGLFPALWAVEGLGLYYAETFRERKLPLKNILTDPALASIPEKSMTMLHAGIGLSFAKRSLEGLKATSHSGDLRKALERFIALCKENSRPGYLGCALESLGIPTVIMHSLEMARAVDRELMQIDSEAASFFWRGAGRALYFYPKNFIPGWDCPWRGYAISSELALHEMARKNLRAGIAWATTVVNMRNPEIMETLLQWQGGNNPDRDAFISGMTSSMIMRYDTSPDDPYIQDFIEHPPDPANQLLCRLWRRDVKEPCEAAIKDIYPVLKKYQRLDEVFHYQSLPDLVKRLEGSGAKK
jgi:hypothetical protein